MLKVKIESVEQSQTNIELTLRINPKTVLVALIKNEKSTLYKKGDTVYALVAYNNIIVGL